MSIRNRSTVAIALVSLLGVGNRLHAESPLERMKLDTRTLPATVIMTVNSYCVEQAEAYIKLRSTELGPYHAFDESLKKQLSLEKAQAVAYCYGKTKASDVPRIRLICDSLAVDPAVRFFEALNERRKDTPLQLSTRQEKVSKECLSNFEDTLIEPFRAN